MARNLRIHRRKRTMRSGKFFAAAAALVASLAGVGAQAAEPKPWEIGYQPAATPVMERIEEFHNLLLVIIFLIAGFVLILLIVTMLKFNAKRNLVPSRSTHNTMLEIVWTAVPAIILVVIAVPSFKLLYFDDVVPKADMTLKAIGHQWYWSYEYPDQGKISFDANVIPPDEIKPGQIRLLSTDNPVVVPVNTTIRVLITATDVIHSWAVPSFGVKTDAVPGRLNHAWFRAEKVGTYYGQCSELCGVNHGFMPIEVKVVSKQKFAEWVKSKHQAAMGRAKPGEVAQIEHSAR